MESDLHIYLENNKINLLLYKKTRHNILKQLLLHLTCNNDLKNYFVAVFDEDGRDYLGNTDIDGINNILNTFENVSIYNKNYDELPDTIKNRIDYTKYNYWKEFGINQLNNI